MKRFATGILTDEPHPGVLELCSQGPDWSIEIEPDRTSGIWVYENGSAYCRFPNPKLAERGARPAGHLHITCSELGIAEAVQSLIRAGAVIQWPNPPDGHGPPPVYPLDEFNPSGLEAFESSLLERQSFWLSDVALHGVVTARRAWGDASMIYGIEKWHLSWKLESITVHSVHPRYGSVFSSEPGNYAYHVNAAAAINLAYSVIEELNCEIRSSSRRPRFHNRDGQRIWNPDVYDELGARLESYGIDIAQPFEWVVRGGDSPVYEDFETNLAGPSEWNHYPENRDLSVTLAEALHFSARLRSYITAHRFTDVIHFIGPYDVFNVQSVARLLILQRLGLWRVSADDLRTELTSGSGSSGTVPESG